VWSAALLLPAALSVSCKPKVCQVDFEDCESPGTCGEDASPTMNPGANCMNCHTTDMLIEVDGDPPENDDYMWTAAGTAFTDEYGRKPAMGAKVRITDAEDNVIELLTNAAGNFYTEKEIVFPYHVEIEVNGKVEQDPSERDNGSCNECHSCGGEAGAKLFAP
jgi:hypothetical protein